jgi:hypothetical protein
MIAQVTIAQAMFSNSQYYFINFISKIKFLLGQITVGIPGCEGVVDTLIRHKLFPSKPINPHIAFTFELLDLYAELLLQAHVPYLSFCRVLGTSQKMDKVRILILSNFNVLKF